MINWGEHGNFTQMTSIFKNIDIFITIFYYFTSKLKMILCTHKFESFY